MLRLNDSEQGSVSDDDVPTVETDAGTEIQIVEELDDKGALGDVTFKAGDDVAMTQVSLELLEEALEYYNRAGHHEDVHLHIMEGEEDSPLLLSAHPGGSIESVCLMPIVQEEP